MVANNKQQEVFIINDIEMEINPSDIQVMDDNWVMEDSYLRSKAVFCYRSKYSATKVVLNIPFQISYLTEEDKTQLNNTYNCIKLISELNAYPFCFIKNNRIKSYISPTSLSTTDYLVFAVDEIAVVQDAMASNMVFLEVVLQYFNHVPLVKDFEFRSNLNVQLNNKGDKVEENIAADVVNSLRDSAVWKQYMNPRVKKVLSNLTESGLLDYTQTDNKSIHPMMGVELLAPTMSVITQGRENVDDGRYVGKDTKIITVTDVSKYDEGTFESLIANLSRQDFSFDAAEFKNTETVQTINSENRIKQSETVISKEKSTSSTKKENEEIVNPFIEAAENYKKLVASENITKETLNKTISKGSKDVFIDWVGHDIQSLALGIQKIEVRRKNRLVTHQIGSYKHPVVQYMGKYPVNVSVSIASTNFEIYQTDEPPVNVFIKQVLNVLDYNRMALPEAEAYNFIKIKSLATFLFDCESFLPSQSVVSTSANSQGLEQIVYTFNEGDLTEFIEQGRTEASGKGEIDKGQVELTNIIISWLLKMPSTLNSIVNNSKSDDNLSNMHILEVYKYIVELALEAMNEMSMTSYPHYTGMVTATELAGDLKPNNNVVRKLKPITDTKETKGLEKYKLYAKYYYVDQTKSVGSSRPQDYQQIIADQRKEYDQIKDEGISVTTLQLHNALIPFMVYILRTRSDILGGKGTNLPSISFVPSGKFNNLALTIISKIHTGLKEGAVVNGEAINTETVKGILDEVSNQYAKVFFGYNIEDLDFEILASKGYNKNTDLLIPKVDPFFFIKETTILDGNEFEAIYDRMYKDSNYNKDLLENLNANDNTDKDIVDNTMKNLGVTYRKLQEIDYIPINTKDLNPNGTIGYTDKYGHIMSGMPNKGSASSAKQMSSEVSAAIEKALVKYGLNTNNEFRQYMYAVLLIESSNGTDLGSDTGAVGLFQFTSGATKDLLQWKQTKLEYSNGSKVGYANPANDSLVSRVKSASKTDHYLNAQMFIEKYTKERSSNTQKNGATNPVYSFIQHNIGGGGLEDIVSILDRGAINFSRSDTRENIRKQSKSFIGSNDVQTTRNYYNHMASKLSIDNVPDHLDINVKASVKNTVDKLTDNLSNQNKKLINQKTKGQVPLVYQKQYIDAINKEYKATTGSTSDTTSKNTISSKTLKGVVTSTKDGDTVYFKDTSTNKTHELRLYGVDTPESTKGGKPGEILGDNAKKALTDLVVGKEVTAQLNGKDKYNRPTAIIKLKDGTDVSLKLLRNGYGFLADGFTTIGSYSQAQEEAKKKQAGLWSYPDGVVTKPRAENKVDLSPLTNTDLQNIKNNVNYQQFTPSDLQYAKDVRRNALNNYQPFAGGSKFKVNSPFGLRPAPAKGASTNHKGVDLASTSGTTVVAAASGVVVFSGVKEGYGGIVQIDHGNGFETRYAHVKKRLVKQGDKVTSQQAIAISGGAKGDSDRGTSTGEHLHYEVRYNGSAINPFGTKELSLYKQGDADRVLNTTNIITGELPQLEMTRKGVTKENTVYNEDKLADAIFKNIYKNTNIGMKTALPAIKIYMTVGNENDKFWLDTLKGEVLYYELKGVKSFHMNCNNDGNPVDTAIISIADPSFLNSDAFAGIDKMQRVNTNAIGTSQEMQFKNNRIQLKTGNKLHVRMGYGNSPSELDIVFNGSIVDVETANQSLNLICEGFGKELLSEIVATDKPKFMNDQNDNISTSLVIGESLIAETIEHFGYNSGFLADKFRSMTDPENRALGNGNVSMSYNWFFDFSKAIYKNRLFMNVFAPEIELLDDEFNKYKGWISNVPAMGSNHMGGYPFAVYKMTPWQCMKQMEYRHPNTICKPMIYEDRMTLFYGIKEQMYFKKDLNKALQFNAAQQKDDGVGFDLTAYYNKRRERLEPVSNIHLVTSSNNLINNGLRLNATYSTKVKVNYYDSKDSAYSAKPWELEVFEAKADDNLYPFDIRTKELTLSGCIGRYSAFLYGTTELKKEAEKMYAGKILMLGNSSVKAGDYVFLDDSDKRMHGLVLVRECYHHFDEKNGFITEIVPGQYVEAANFMYSSLWLNLMCACKIVSSKMKTVIGSNFYASDFNMVTDYLTVLRQAELELDKVSERKKDPTVMAIYAGTTGLSLILINSLAKTLGIGNKNALLKFAGINLGAGVYGFSKNFLRVFVNQTDLYLYKKMQTKLTALAKTGSGKVNLWLDRSKVDIRGLLSQPKHIIASSKFMEEYRSARAAKTGSSLIWKASKPVLGLGAKAALEAAKLTGRVLYSTLLAITLSNPLTLVIDAIVYMAIQYAFAKIEEEQIMRQPLLYFPLIRHGKPYVGGMAGVVRNTWRASQITEGKKTIKEIQKAASILVGNNDSKNLSSDRPFYISLLNGVAGSSAKKAPSIYQTDADGTRIGVRDNKIMTEEQSNNLTRSRLRSYLQDEENMKNLLIQKMNDNVVGSL